MLIVCAEKDLLCLNLEVSFPKDMILMEILQLNDNRLYDTPVNLQSCNLAGVPNFWPMCLFFCKSNFVWSERWRSQRFQSC